MALSNLKSKQSIGRKIERIREIRGIKQDALAAAIGVTQQTISKIEKSETIDEEKLRKIAEALGVSADTIKNFNEEAIINNINSFHDNSSVNTLVNTSVNNQYNPIDKLIEVVEENRKLYERLLKEKDEVIDLYKQKQS